MGASNKRLRPVVGVALAFVIGLSAAVIAFEIADRLRSSRREPLVPAAERKQADPLEMPTLTSETSGPAATTNSWSLQQQRGKVVVVNYFATWCPPCVAETPDLVTIAKEYSQRGVVFAGVSMDRDGEQVKGKTREAVLHEFASAHAITYPLLLPQENSSLWKIEFPIPETYLYDRQGRLAQTIMGGIDVTHMRAWLDELLKESP